MRKAAVTFLWALASLSFFATGLALGQESDRSIWTPPVDISTEGHRSDSLFILVTWMITVLFVIMTAIMIIAAWKFRARPGSHAQYDRGDSKKDAVIALSISTVIFLVVDGTLLWRSHVDVNEVYWKYPETEPDVVRVQVLAQQWAWNFRYAGEDGEFNTPDDIVTFNDFRVPEGKKVYCQITSKDVIHSFFLANARMKRDANPGEITRMWFQTKPGTAGRYEVTCAEICGFAHYMMRADFHVLKEADWQAWVAEATRWSELAYDPDKAEQHWGWTWRPENRAVQLTPGR